MVIIGGGGGGDGGRRFAEAMVAAQQEAGTPFAIASSMGPATEPELVRMYADAGIGVFPTADRAVGAFAGVVGYAKFRREIGAPLD